MERIYSSDCKSTKKEIKFLKLLLIKSFFIITTLIVAIIWLFSFCGCQSVFAEKSMVYASSYIVIDADTKAILTGENIDAKLPMASTTKIMTALVALENLDTNKFINIHPNAIGVEGSSIYLNADKKYKILDLIYGLMLRSGNDAAEALAYETSGSIEKFAELMNSKAEKLGLTNTHFMNPHGLHDKDHYTSAYDLAIISAAAMSNEIFKEIVSSKIHLVDSSEHGGAYYNKNKLLSTYEGANGIKTGYTKVAGRCLVSSAERNGVQLVGVVLNCSNMWNDSKSMLDYAFSQYSTKKIINANTPIVKSENYQLITKEDVYVSCKKNEKLDVNISLELKKDLVIPIEKDSEIGFINIYSGNRLLFSKKIYTIKAITNREEFDTLKNLVVNTEYGKIE